jgi:2-keto-4-pentenoate hydratase/2-oxohepta-3-ene-1,7-dioic acid hydratase in catechol pathway
MRLVLFDDHRPGVLTDGGVLDLSAEVGLGDTGQQTLERLITGWDALRPRLEQASGDPRPLESVRLRAPVPRPGKILCMAANFREGTEAEPLPINGFLASSDAILDPGGTAVLPPQEFTICHHEAELVCVIGKEGRDVSRDDAMDYVFGYTAGVDVSARGAWGFLGKSCDGFKPIGPCIATADGIADPHALDVQLSVDGVLRQDYSTSDIGHRIPECIEWFSSFLTIRPGDLLFVGTNHQQLGPLQDGETVEMEIASIGSFSFHVADPKRRSWPKEVDASVGENLRRRLETAGAAGAA